LTLLCLLTYGFFFSCSILPFREVKCRDFEYQDELKWYAGSIGEIITFSNERNETKAFVIQDKYLLHRTKYTSDTGCDCHDRWGIMLVEGNDTISMYSDSKYIEKNSAKRYDYFYVKYNNALSSFITEDKSIVSNYKIGNETFAQVMIFEHSYAGNSQFEKVVVAPEIGVIELFETNGNVWINTNLEKKLSIGLNSFVYEEYICN